MQDTALRYRIVELADPPLVDAKDFRRQQIIIRIYLIWSDFTADFVPFLFGGIVFTQLRGRINGVERRDVDDGFPLVERRAVVAVLRDILVVNEPLVQHVVVALFGDEIRVADIAVMERNSALTERLQVVSSSARSTYIDKQARLGLF